VEPEFGTTDEAEAEAEVEAEEEAEAEVEVEAEEEAEEADGDGGDDDDELPIRERRRVLGKAARAPGVLALVTTDSMTLSIQQTFWAKMFFLGIFLRSSLQARLGRPALHQAVKRGLEYGLESVSKTLRKDSRDSPGLRSSEP